MRGFLSKSEYYTKIVCYPLIRTGPVFGEQTNRGLLSWLNQVRPESFTRRDFREREWNLEDAGSYGYRTSIQFNREAIERALDEKVFRIKLVVNESSDTSGGLAVYGEQFGRYPLGPTVIIRMKETVEVVESNPFTKRVSTK